MITHSGAKGVSQGHSDAIRRVEGVKDGKQYTIPVEAALEAVRNGENPELTTRDKQKYQRMFCCIRRWCGCCKGRGNY